MTRFDNFVRKSLHFFKHGNIYIVLVSPVLVSLLIFIVGGYFAQKNYPEGIPEIVQGFIIFVAGIIASLSGVAQIYRRESPGPFGKVLRGKWPIFNGLLICLFFWILSLLGLWFAFKN